MDIELVFILLLLANRGGNRNREEIVRRIGEMTGAERRCLRRALRHLDSALDDVIINERLERLRRNSPEPQSSKD